MKHLRRISSQRRKKKKKGERTIYPLVRDVQLVGTVPLTPAQVRGGARPPREGKGPTTHVPRNNKTLDWSGSSELASGNQ